MVIKMLSPYVRACVPYVRASETIPYRTIPSNLIQSPCVATVPYGTLGL